MNVEDAIAETMQKQHNVTLLGTQQRIPVSMQQQKAKSQPQSPYHMHSSSSNSSSGSSSQLQSSSSLLGHQGYGNSNEGMGYAVKAGLPLPMLLPVVVSEEQTAGQQHHRGATTTAASLFESCAAWSSWSMSSLASSYDAVLAVSFFFLWLAVGVIWTQVHNYIT